MAEKKLAEIVAAAIPTKQVYEDLAQPASQEIGKTSGQLAGLVGTALRPVFTIQMSVNLLFDRLDNWLRVRLAGVPPEKIAAPPPAIAGPAVMGLALVQDEPTLRDLFVSLIASAMKTDTQAQVHPAFVTVIKQLAPVEASLLVSFRHSQALPALQLWSYQPGSTSFSLHGIGAPKSEVTAPSPGTPEEEVRRFLMTAYDGGRHHAAYIVRLSDETISEEHHLPNFDNLERLGLIQRSLGSWLSGDERSYVQMATCPDACATYERVLADGGRPGAELGTVSLTPFGHQFIKCCFQGADIVAV